MSKRDDSLLMIQQWLSMPFHDPAEKCESALNISEVDVCICGSSSCAGCLPPPDREIIKSAEFIEFEKAMDQYEKEFEFQNIEMTENKK